MMHDEHGGDLSALMQRYGHAPADILDLSTGIAPRSWPIPSALCDVARWQPLPQARDEAALRQAAQASLGLDASAAICIAPGSQILINLVATLRPAGRVLIPEPAYAEHAAAWSRCGHDIGFYAAGTCPDAASGCVVAVQPGNPAGDHLPPAALAELAGRLAKKGGLLVVDEAFADLIPGASLAPYCGIEGLIVLRSFGKFFGLAGLRLGLALGPQQDITRLTEMMGPWAVSTPALQIGAAALADIDFQHQQRQWISRQHDSLVAVLDRHGIRRVGGTPLYVLAEVEDAASLQNHLAKAAIWTRVFAYHKGWIRFGLAADAAGLSRLDDALADRPVHAD